MRKLFKLLALFTVSIYAQEVYATFDVEASKHASLAFSSSGVIEKMNVDIGSSVEKGSLLASLLNSDIQAMVEVQKVALEHAKRDYDRQLKVKAQINQSLLDSFAYKFNHAKAQLKYQEALLAKSYLYAPFDGVITAKKVEVGDVVSGQMITEVFDIQSLKERKLIVQFDQKYHTSVKVGDTFTYHLDGDDTSYRGTIDKIYPTINTQSRKMSAEIKAQDFPVGLFGDGYITTK